MNTNRIFELYAKYVWPVVRLFVKKSNRCQRCILSEKYAVLTNGLCTECANYTTEKKEYDLIVQPETAKRFQDITRSYITNLNHHAILLLSGGKDSAYILNRMRQDFPDLRILCVIVNNGFMSPLALESAKFITDKLHVDLLVINSYVCTFAKVLREAFLNLRGKGGSGVVDHADGTLIFKIGQQIAKEMKIPLMISGLSWVQVQRIVGINDFELTEGDGPRQLFPLAVWRPNEQEIRAEVRERQLMPRGSDSPIVSNSSLILAMSVLDILNLGYCSFEPEFAQLVREGKTDRNTWLHLFELLEFGTRSGILKKDLEKILHQLNLKSQDVTGASL